MITNITSFYEFIFTYKDTFENNKILLYNIKNNIPYGSYLNMI